MRFILILVLLILLFSQAYANQESVEIFELVKCNMFDFFCKMEKSVVNSAYGMQEANYLMINSTFTNINAIQVLDHDPFIRDLNQFFIEIIKIVFYGFFLYIFFSFMTTGGNLYNEIKAKENLSNLLKGMLIIAFLPFIMIFVNDFFYQLNLAFISNTNFSNLILYNYTQQEGVFSFWIITFLIWVISLFISIILMFYKVLLFFSTTLIIIIGALWYLKHNVAKFLRDILLMSYLHIPLLIILLNTFQAMVSQDLGYISTLIAFMFILLIFIAINMYIIFSNIIKQLAHHIANATKKAHLMSSSRFSKRKKVSNNNKLGSQHDLKKIELEKQNLKKQQFELQRQQGVMKAEKDFWDLSRINEYSHK